MLVNGLGLMPVWYYGTEEQKKRFIGRATADTTGEFIVGYAASEPPVRRAAPPTSTHPLRGRGNGCHSASATAPTTSSTARKYWPCNVAGWDGNGADLNLVVVRTDSDRGGTEGLSAIIVERGTPGVTYNLISTSAQRSAQNARSSSRTPEFPPTT